MIPKEADPVPTSAASLQEIHLAATFAFVSRAHRAPADEIAHYPLQLSLDLCVPGQEVRLVFDSDVALDALYRALQSLVDDRDTADAAETTPDPLLGGLIVRLFTSRTRDENDPADGELAF